MYLIWTFLITEEDKSDSITFEMKKSDYICVQLTQHLLALSYTCTLENGYMQ